MASEAQATRFTTTFPALVSRRRPFTEHAARMGTWLRQSLCAVNGHDKYLHVEGTRVTLRCVTCQHDSPGWDTGGRAYQRTYAGDPGRHRIR
ncbi:hypothetical protein TBR22_A45370 [Luteitalea sp. TBR-22]|uniref:hypothetical protein n=1 Tax=Luteitalea sp. TBR-22 TaxID=2802971 RepID=UPI001AFC8DBC|nr:hypothetical protein [Luteitalea sp. TBR-22]BCS35310.1 hypothetical protein TBR22_A45370 [Luteitalea sp. TBR-22]